MHALTAPSADRLALLADALSITMRIYSQFPVCRVSRVRLGCTSLYTTECFCSAPKLNYTCNHRRQEERRPKQSALFVCESQTRIRKKLRAHRIHFSHESNPGANHTYALVLSPTMAQTTGGKQSRPVHADGCRPKCLSECQSVADFSQDEGRWGFQQQTLSRWKTTSHTCVSGEQTACALAKW